MQLKPEGLKFEWLLVKPGKILIVKIQPFQGCYITLHIHPEIFGGYYYFNPSGYKRIVVSTPQIFKHPFYL